MSVKTENIENIVKSTIPDLHPELLAYIVHVVNDPHEVFTKDSLFDAIGPLLSWYGIHNKTNDAHQICVELLKNLRDAQAILVPEPDALTKQAELYTTKQRNSWNIALEEDRSRIAPGLQIFAKYYMDNQFYPAIIEKITPDGSFVVNFTDYDSLECVSLFDIKVPGDELAEKLFKRQQLESSGRGFEDYTLEEMALVDELEMAFANEIQLNGAGGGASAGSTLAVHDDMVRLPQPIRIADFGEKKEAPQEVVEENKIDTIVSKKDLKLQQKEKRRIDLLRQRELKRQERDQQQREDALRLYLSNSQSAKSRNMDIHINHFSLNSPDGSKELLEDSTFSLNQGRIYGLIGSNGVGKTTLLKAIANYEVPGVEPHLRIVHVEQECRGDGFTALQTVLRGDIEREILIREELRLRNLLEQAHGDNDDGSDGATNTTETTTSATSDGQQKRSLAIAASTDDEDNEAEAQRFHKLFQIMQKTQKNIDPSTLLAQVYSRMDAIDAWSAEARAAAILSGLQFTPERMNMPTKSLSGGWRMRVSLAAALFVRPDLLLLDEPTNHLDFPAVLWLEEYLNNYDRTCIVISHDRMFLNNVITDVLHFYRRQLTCYRGNYAVFEKVRDEQIKLQKRTFEAQQAKVQHMQEFIDKFRFNANRAALVQSRVKALKRMDVVEDVEEDATFTMSFPSPGDNLNGQSAIDATNLTFSYTGEPPYLLKDVNCHVDCKTRVGILGANGIGKTTLLQCLLGVLKPTDGSVYINGGARISTFAQHHLDKLKPELTPLELLTELFPRNHPQLLRRHLGKFGVNGSMQTQIISSLSGGQKSRVAFSILMWDKPHIIALDEPTNHLDLETVDALIGAVQGFDGGVVIVSHDQHFVSAVCNEFWVVAHGDVKRFTDFAEAKAYTQAQSSV